VEPFFGAMKRAISHARAAGALILIGLAACDNVNWGGVDVAIVPPPPQARPVAPVAAGDSTVQRLPEGPILYYVAPSGGTGTMVPVAEIAGDSLRSLHGASDPDAFAARFIAEHMRQGAEFVLFREGARVGTMVVQSADVAQGGETCPAVPRATGSLELSPTAASAREFLALSKLAAPQTARDVPPVLVPSRNMQVVAPIIAERLMRARRAGLPGNWQRAMAQLQPFPVNGVPQPGYATTFLVGDTLGPGLDDEGYSIFYIGIPSEASYDTAFVDYRQYPQGGKAAPRVVDFLDWDRDEQVELLLQVYGVSDSWFEAMGNGPDGDWQRIFHERCQVAPERAPATATDTAR
jgi:hypothetical protein